MSWAAPQGSLSHEAAFFRKSKRPAAPGSPTRQRRGRSALGPAQAGPFDELLYDVVDGALDGTASPLSTEFHTVLRRVGHPQARAVDAVDGQAPPAVGVRSFSSQHPADLAEQPTDRLGPDPLPGC